TGSTPRFSVRGRDPVPSRPGADATPERARAGRAAGVVGRPASGGAATDGARAAGASGALAGPVAVVRLRPGEGGLVAGAARFHDARAAGVLPRGEDPAVVRRPGRRGAPGRTPRPGRRVPRTLPTPPAPDGRNHPAGLRRRRRERRERPGRAQA